VLAVLLLFPSLESGVAADGNGNGGTSNQSNEPLTAFDGTVTSHSVASKSQIGVDLGTNTFSYSSSKVSWARDISTASEGNFTVELASLTIGSTVIPLAGRLQSLKNSTVVEQSYSSDGPVTVGQVSCSPSIQMEFRNMTGVSPYDRDVVLAGALGCSAPSATLAIQFIDALDLQASDCDTNGTPSPCTSVYFGSMGFNWAGDNASQPQYNNVTDTLTMNVGSTFFIDPEAVDGSGTCTGSVLASQCTLSFTTSNPSDVLILGQTSSNTCKTPGSSGSLTWTLRKDVPYYGGGTHECMYYAVWSSDGSMSVTCKFGGTGRIACIGFGVSDADTHTIFDGHSGLPCTGTGTGSPASCSLSTSNSNDLIMGLMGQASAPTNSAGSGFTLLSCPERESARTQCAETKVVSSTQSGLSVGYTWSGSSVPWGMIGDAIMQAPSIHNVGKGLLVPLYCTPYTNDSGSSCPINPILSNVKNASATVSSSPYQVTLSNFAAGNGTDRLLVVGISANDKDVASITFGGTALTQSSAHSFTNNDAEFWYLVEPTGVANIVVTMAGATSVVVGAYAFSQVDQSDPIPDYSTAHNSSPSSPSISLTTSYANSTILALASIYGAETLGSPTCTGLWNNQVSGEITGASSLYNKASAGAYTCGWTAHSADYWDAVAIEIKADLASFSWQPLVDAKNNHPGVNITAVINPESGLKGCSESYMPYDDYNKGIAALESAGITVLGYVDTDYTKNSTAAVEGQINNYDSCMAVQGIFFDNMNYTNSMAASSYYSTLRTYVESHGMSHTIGNPGTTTYSRFTDTVDNIVISETVGMPSTADVPDDGSIACPIADGSCPYGNASGFSFISYDVTSLPSSGTVSTDAGFVTLFYFSDNTTDNPYDTISTYTGPLAADLS
jgi:hypothetical protein